jgi:hypothetical protein
MTDEQCQKALDAVATFLMPSPEFMADALINGTGVMVKAEADGTLSFEKVDQNDR